MKVHKILIIMLVIFAFTASFGVAQAHGDHGAGQEKVTQLIKQALPDVPGRNVMLITVDYLPGQSTKPHEHPGSVIAYVLEGSFISQLAGQAPVTYHAGQYWYEPPHTGHIMAKNASNTRPAKLLVWLLLGDKDPVKLPYPNK